MQKSRQTSASVHVSPVEALEHQNAGNAADSVDLVRSNGDLTGKYFFIVIVQHFRPVLIVSLFNFFTDSAVENVISVHSITPVEATAQIAANEIGINGVDVGVQDNSVDSGFGQVNIYIFVVENMMRDRCDG